MKRRNFIQRIAAASLAFSVGPTAFKCLPAARNVRAVVVAQRRELYVVVWNKGRCGLITYADFKARLDAARTSA